MANLDAPFSFVVFLGMLHYSLWEMPVRGRTVTRNLKFSLIWMHWLVVTTMRLKVKLNDKSFKVLVFCFWTWFSAIAKYMHRVFEQPNVNTNS